MESNADDPIEEAQRIFTETAGAVVVEETVKQLFQKAIPMVSLFEYLISKGVSKKTAEKMLMTVWRNWFGQAIVEEWHHFLPEGPGED